MAKRQSVRLRGRQVSALKAALIAQEADRLGVLPRDVGDVVVPKPAPKTVLLAGFTVSIAAGAAIAEVSDAEGIHPKKLIERITHEYAEALDRRARSRANNRPLEGSWMLPSDPDRRRR
ncbi:MAG TPA: hypothetical protein VK420_16520 [Longimicrobium sp.]|nr:hypothetical protein [Longimicrobium sp.]